MRLKLLFVTVAIVALLISGCSAEKEKMNTRVILETSKGTIEIELNQQQAPVTVANFLAYVNEGHYDGTVFHRVIPGFMIQGGGFTPDGTQKPTREPIKLESNNGLKNEMGTIAMARTSVPDSATSQFFINVANNDFLNYAPGNDGYAAFGKVVSGMEAVNAIAAVETGNREGNSDWPVEDIVITKAYVKK
ncbi:peptidyl-prolyl cis-trans isomerase [Candidatus Woesearchaeota archaeon]|nr:peptidyl-prolyl cis-trans isomerase [Candidatus Woesearchaeota archaeon]